MDLQREGNDAIGSNPASCAQQQKWVDQKLNERQDPPSLSLDEQGMILDCSNSFEMLFGVKRSELFWHHVSMLFPQLTGVDLVQNGKFNPLLNYLCRCGHLYQAQNRQGDSFSSSLNFAHIGYDGSRSVRMFVQPQTWQRRDAMPIPAS
jgi:hypothetical protein